MSKVFVLWPKPSLHCDVAQFFDYAQPVFRYFISIDNLFGEIGKKAFQIVYQKKFFKGRPQDHPPV